MADLNKGNAWGASITQDVQSQTYTFDTKDKYADRDISITIAAKTGILDSADGAVSGNNVTLSDSNTSGISVTGSGKGIVTTAGWINQGKATAASKTQYISKITLPAGKTVQLDDGIYLWTWTTDANGNVTII